MIPPPINIPKWLEENQDKLAPPVNNYCLHRGGFTVMIIGGPNERSDYHVNTTPEWFYQYKGEITLKIVDDGVMRDVPIKEGESFLLPANVPHSPVRFKNTVGIVVEQDRPVTVEDHMRWYCAKCKSLCWEAGFHMADLGSQVKDAIEHFDSDLKARTCDSCGHVNQSRPEVPIADPNVPKKTPATAALNYGYEETSYDRRASVVAEASSPEAAAQAANISAPANPSPSGVIFRTDSFEKKVKPSAAALAHAFSETNYDRRASEVAQHPAAATAAAAAAVSADETSFDRRASVVAEASSPEAAAQAAKLSAPANPSPSGVIFRTDSFEKKVKPSAAALAHAYSETNYDRRASVVAQHPAATFSVDDETSFDRRASVIAHGSANEAAQAAAAPAPDASSLSPPPPTTISPSTTNQESVPSGSKLSSFKPSASKVGLAETFAETNYDRKASVVAEGN